MGVGSVNPSSWSACSKTGDTPSSFQDSMPSDTDNQKHSLTSKLYYRSISSFHSSFKKHFVFWYTLLSKSETFGKASCHRHATQPTCYSLLMLMEFLVRISTGHFFPCQCHGFFHMHTRMYCSRDLTMHAQWVLALSWKTKCERHSHVNMCNMDAAKPSDISLSGRCKVLPSQSWWSLPQPWHFHLHSDRVRLWMEAGNILLFHTKPLAAHQFIYLFIEGFKPHQPHRVTSWLFTKSNLTQIEYNTKHAHFTNLKHIYIYKHNPKVSPFGNALIKNSK